MELPLAENVFRKSNDTKYPQNEKLFKMMVIKKEQSKIFIDNEINKYFGKLEQYLFESFPEKRILLGKQGFRDEIKKAFFIGQHFGFLSERANALFVYLFFFLTNNRDTLMKDEVLSDMKISADQKLDYINKTYLGL